ncbi:MAG: arsenite methyltransferase [Ardenticatenaceae bacterium]|nr:arsenite methyltransferase [Ardenticatenaceae bacterium]MCB9446146.1 arsenite methyltransferase [Ardenticatenaceae bacterium]
MSNLSPDKIHEEVKAKYGRIADEFKVEVSASCCRDSVDNDCCGADNDQAVEMFANLYQADTNWLPDEVTGMSLGCGDPITLANLAEGLTVLDLGSGGGIDCFMAARQVGPAGHVIGVDMTEAMIAKANRNKAKVGLDNVEFRLGQIEDMPVEANSVDVIISNCVINLAPDKTAVFREAFRVLKPGGRLAVSDIVTQGHFTPQERANMASWTGCIAGAEDVGDYVSAMRAAGFTNISVRDKAAPEVELANSLSLDVGVRVFSARVTAVKPKAEG